MVLLIASDIGGPGATFLYLHHIRTFLMFGRCIWWVPLDWIALGTNIQKTLQVHPHILHMTGKTNTKENETLCQPEQIFLTGEGKCTFNQNLASIELSTVAVFPKRIQMGVVFPKRIQMGHVSIAYRWKKKFQQTELFYVLEHFKPNPSTQIQVQIWMCNGNPSCWKKKLQLNISLKTYIALYTTVQTPQDKCLFANNVAQIIKGMYAKTDWIAIAKLFLSKIRANDMTPLIFQHLCPSPTPCTFRL